MSALSDSQHSASSSKAQLQQSDALTEEELVLNIKNDEAEIARLELESKNNDKNPNESSTKSSASTYDEERIAKIQFECSSCGMNEMVHYYGQAPPFVCGISFCEQTFVMRDPFAPPPPRWKPKPEYFIALGAKCCECQQIVCKDSSCSFFYTRTYCMSCGQSNLGKFPNEAQAKLRKQLAMRT